MKRDGRDDNIIFEENFESGVTDWSIGPGWEFTTSEFHSENHSMFSTHSHTGKNSIITSPLIQLPDTGINEIMYFSFFLNFDMPDSDGDGDDILDDYYQVQLKDNSDKACHISSYNAADDNSYWCGDETINGYKDAWIQFLDTPTISIEEGYRLTAQMMWKIEAPDAYDDGSFVDGSCTNGWDAANIRISINGGVDWTLLEVPSQPYDFNCGYGWIYNDSQYESGGSLESLAPGWGGNSDGWQDFSVDLSAYADEDIIIRFAFGSDPELSTNDNSSLKGFFVDDITINDASGTNIVSYTADDGDGDLMAASGYSLKNLSSDYVTWDDQFCYDPQSSDILDSYTNQENCEADSFKWFVSKGSMGWEKSDLFDLADYGGREVNLIIRSIYDNNNDGDQGAGIYVDDFIVEKFSTAVYYHPWDFNAHSSSSEVTLTWADMNASGTDSLIIYDSGKFDDTLFTESGSSWAGEIFDIIGPSTVNMVSIYNINPDTTIVIGAFAELGWTFNTNPIYAKTVDLATGWNDIAIPYWEMENPFIIAYQFNDVFGGALDTNVFRLKAVVNTGDAWKYAYPFGGFGEFGIRANIDYEGADVTYNMYRDDAILASALTEHTYTDSNVVNKISYEYAVSATYLDGKESAKTDSIIVTPLDETVHEIGYDDGTFEGGQCTETLYTSQDSCEINNADWGFNTGTNHFSAVRFSAASSGENIVFFKWFQNGSGGALYIKVFEDDGGMPGAEINSAISTSTANSDGWNTKDLSGLDLSVSGYFWAGIKGSGTAKPFGLDTTLNVGTSYQRTGLTGDWTQVDGNLAYHVYLDCGSNTLDECNVCGGDNLSCVDECGIPNGDNSSCADCGGVIIEDGAVWPGDTNSDGIVNVNDILPIGFYWDSSACERSLLADDMYKWDSQPLPENNCISHADANGDGKVDIADILVIMVNWQRAPLPSANEGINNSCGEIDDFSRYYSNYSQIYNSLTGNSSQEIQMRSRLEELFDFTPIPNIYQIYQNYPNPFNPSTSIPYYLSERSNVVLSVFDLMGRRVIQEGAYILNEGVHEIIINGQNLSSGVYFYQFTINGNEFIPKKMVLLK